MTELPVNWQNHRREEAMGPKSRSEIDDEMLESLAGKHVDAMLSQKRSTGFDGEVLVKYQFRKGCLHQVHVDSHDVISGAIIRGAGS